MLHRSHQNLVPVSNKYLDHKRLIKDQETHQHNVKNKQNSRIFFREFSTFSLDQIDAKLNGFITTDSSKSLQRSFKTETSKIRLINKKEKVR